MVGDAVGFAMFELLKPVPGDQLYVVPPLAVSTTLPLLQIVAVFGVTLALGNGATFIKTVAVLVQPY